MKGQEGLGSRAFRLFLTTIVVMTAINSSVSRLISARRFAGTSLAFPLHNSCHAYLLSLATGDFYDGVRCVLMPLLQAAGNRLDAAVGPGRHVP